MTNPKFSIVVPIYNEGKTILELYKRLTTVMDKLCAEEVRDIRERRTKLRRQAGEVRNHDKKVDHSRRTLDTPYEIIMVNDGSTDQSWQIIKRLHKENPKLVGIDFSRNFGHHIAITAGLDYTKGDFVVMMDGDLQDPPEEIPKLYQKLMEGYDLVYGTRKNRQDNFLRKIGTYFFTVMIKKLSGLEIAQNDAMLRIMSRKFVDSIKKFPERNRFLGGIFSWAGFNQTGIPIEHAPRFAGKSKYGIWKMAKLTMDAVTSFSYLPLKIIGLMGLLISAISFVSGIFLIFKKLFLGVDVIGWTSTMVTILFIGGIQLVVLGIIGQYLARVFSEVQGRPLYIIKELAFD